MQKAFRDSKDRSLSADAIAAFLSSGGKVKRVANDVSSGITHREWKQRVRGEKPPVELPIKRVEGTLHLRVGHGAVK